VRAFMDWPKGRRYRKRCAEATLFFGAGLVMLWRDERSNR